MNWCSVADMRLVDMNREDCERIGCDGKCESCGSSTYVVDDFAAEPDLTAYTDGYRGFFADRFGRIV